ncbi:hypothetical protein NDR87_16570 [Nocardia sp. CDC159]|uniref:PE family protein n=1 Tax=Nocardia pulmonis TaxID=2951408 RepID=A0A9X2E712_9NOCA|nr:MULTISPECIES: hypothetical protein [Nocardia]MCM6775292.1 hypothetical protein [Nocardia pulmonis]MCM6787974.1 hypothetical protein [Nocardia sp. CDC159]
MADTASHSSGGPQSDDQLGYWRNMKQQAEAGTFRLDPDLATELRKHAEEMRVRLAELLNQANRLGALDGFGSLPSSTALKNAFEQKANGSPDSLINQYGKAIEVVTLMRDTYDLSIQKLTSQDAAAAGSIGRAAGGL